MNTTLLAVVMLMLGVRSAVYAQNMVEHSTLPTTTTTASNPIAATSHAVAKKATSLNAAVSQSSPKNSAAGEKSALNQNQTVSAPTVPRPTPPGVFVLLNGERLESSHYLLTATSLRVQQGETQRTIPLKVVNLDATIAANHERGIDLKIPKNNAEVM